MISPGFFFQNFDFSVKGQKMLQNERRFSLCNSISQEPYMIWLPLVVDKCKIIISQGFFLFFQNFDFLVCWWDKRAKNGTKWQKILSVVPYISEIFIYFAHVKKKYLLIFFQFLIFGANSNKMTQMTKWPKMTEYCVVAPISQEAYTIWLWFLVHIYKMMTPSYAFFIFSKFWKSQMIVVFGTHV